MKEYIYASEKEKFGTQIVTLPIRIDICWKKYLNLRKQFLAIHYPREFLLSLVAH
jgi:hypothetical protein